MNGPNYIQSLDKSNYVQTLLIEDQTDSYTEVIADCLLAWPRCMWAETDAEGYHLNNFTNCLYGMTASVSKHNCPLSTILCVCGTPMYIVSSILAAPLFIVGLPIKALSLWCCRDAQTDNLVVNQTDNLVVKQTDNLDDKQIDNIV